MKILLIYYHPIIWDLAETFLRLGHSVSVAVNPAIKDNYGTGLDIFKSANSKYNPVLLPAALQFIKQHKYDLVGCDGVFDGDKLVMETCQNSNIPWFCIDGYPNTMDEPSNNILAFSWALPFTQYNNKFPSEGHKKQVDWKDIAEFGQSKMKNFLVFYPNMWYLQQPFSLKTIKEKKLVSGIQRFEECNRYNYEVFQKVKAALANWDIQNIEGCSHEDFLKEIQTSEGLLHLKWADKPGIAVLESMMLGRPIVTLRSFVLSSFNQEFLIDNYTALIADSVEEITERLKDPCYLTDLSWNVHEHAVMLCSFERQKDKLQRFLDRCVNDK